MGEIKDKWRGFKEVLGVGSSEEPEEDTGIIDIDMKENTEEAESSTPSFFKKPKQEKNQKKKQRILLLIKVL